MASEEYTPVSLTSSGSSYGEPAKTSSPDNDGGLHLYLDNPCVASLPEQGCITFRFVRGPITLRESGKGQPGKASADLTLTEICDVKEEDAPEGIEAKDVVDEIFNSIREQEEKAGAGDADE